MHNDQFFDKYLSFFQVALGIIAVGVVALTIFSMTMLSIAIWAMMTWISYNRLAM